MRGQPRRAQVVIEAPSQTQPATDLRLVGQDLPAPGFPRVAVRRQTNGSVVGTAQESPRNAPHRGGAAKECDRAMWPSPSAPQRYALSGRRAHGVQGAAILPARERGRYAAV